MKYPAANTATGYFYKKITQTLKNKGNRHRLRIYCMYARIDPTSKYYCHQTR